MTTTAPAIDRSFADRARSAELTGHDLAALTYEEKVDLLNWYPLPTLRRWPLESLTGKRQYDVLQSAAVRPEGPHRVRAVVFRQIHPSVVVTVRWVDAFAFLRSNAGRAEVLGVLWEGEPDPVDGHPFHTFAKWMQLTDDRRNGERGGLYWLTQLNGRVVLEEVAK